MKTTIHKYVHQPTHYEVPYTIDMPSNASIFATRMHRGVITSWALVPGEPEKTVPREFLMLTTGREFDLPDTAQYMDTVVLKSNMVAHLFFISDLMTVTPVYE